MENPIFSKRYYKEKGCADTGSLYTNMDRCTLSQPAQYSYDFWLNAMRNGNRDATLSQTRDSSDVRL
jgi:hypothetical protein